MSFFQQPGGIKQHSRVVFLRMDEKEAGRREKAPEVKLSLRQRMGEKIYSLKLNVWATSRQRRVPSGIQAV